MEIIIKKYNVLLTVLLLGITGTLFTTGRALQTAVMNNNVEAVKRLLSNSEVANFINHQNRLGYSAAMLAAINGYTEILEQLIQAGADLSLKNQNGKTAFDLAMRGPNTEQIREIIESAQMPIKSAGKTQ